MTTKQRSKGTGTLVRKVAGSPFVARYFDFAGKRRDRSTHTTDHATAQRILAKFISDTALRRDGVINPRDDRYALEGRKPREEDDRQHACKVETHPATRGGGGWAQH